MISLASTSEAGEACLGVKDKGIWTDLDAKVQVDLPKGLTKRRVRATNDDKHHVLVLWADGFPVKAYPTPLRDGDRSELAELIDPDNTRALADDEAAKALGDRDDDGIPDPLDVLLGATKTALNGDAYTEGYVSMSYPNGDVPRTMGVCTDVIVRSLRNAGLDLQKALHDDIARAPRAYPMVKGKGDPSIDQRRVATLLPYFERHLEAHTAALDDAKDPYRPGDIIFMDTFPSRSGPDHIGIISNRVDDQGLPLVINNWTDGTVTTEMDLLTFVPVTHRFRLVTRP
ncbi:MAG TPA: DUF1287 domain-containing protein [Kofleriaceae bacterium]|nr:DUF1287 domain-containing protein [Kofleriaceae bacterium]